MLKSLDDPTVALLRQRLAVETNSAVKRKSPRAWRFPRLTARTPRRAWSAIDTLRSSVSQDVRNRLALLIDKSSDGTFAESDPKVRQAAASAVVTIDRSAGLYSAIETLFFGLSPDRSWC